MHDSARERGFTYSLEAGFVDVVETKILAPFIRWPPDPRDKFINELGILRSIGEMLTEAFT